MGMEGIVLASLGPASSPWAGWLPLLWEEVTKGKSLGNWRSWGGAGSQNGCTAVLQGVLMKGFQRPQGAFTEQSLSIWRRQKGCPEPEKGWG